MSSSRSSGSSCERRGRGAKVMACTASSSHVLHRWIEPVDGIRVEVNIGREGGGEIGPPLGEEALGDDLEPGRPEEAGGGVHEALELGQGDKFSGIDLVGVGFHG